MKRSEIYDSNSRSSPPYGGYGSSGLNHHDDPYSDGNVVYRSSGMSYNNTRRESSEWSPNEMIRMSEKYGRDEEWGKDDRDTNNVIGTGESITTEIAPGIIVEGYVADL